MKSTIKAWLRKIGLFPIARDLYRRLSIEHRRERRYNRIFFSQIVKKRDLCFDIGANLGQTIEALIECGAVVIAAEPNPLCHPALHHQFKKSKNVIILKKALGRAAGFADLNFRGTDSTASIRNDWGFETEGKVRVEVTTLDNIIEEFGRPKFLKVDVEGFENEVFQGLTIPIELIYFEIIGKEIEATIKILNRLEDIGEIEGVKAISGDNSAWLIDQWCNPNNLMSRLGNPLPRHANLIVKMKV